MTTDLIRIAVTAIIAMILWSKYIDPWLDSGGFKRFKLKNRRR
jgi:hypothetical protein